MKLRIYILLFFIFGASFVYAQNSKSGDVKIVKNHIPSSHGIRIYPNPVTDYFKIDSKVTIGKIEIYNLIGKKVKSQNNDRGDIFDASNLRNGMYLVRIYSQKGKVLRVLRLGVNNESP